jgi:hypothetical protein
MSDARPERARHFAQWRDFEDAVATEAAALEARWHVPSAVPFFRGHKSTEFDLRPSLLRPYRGRWFTPKDERTLFYDFLSRGGSVLPPGLDSWDLLFLMRHHGVVTRLLDWSESFAAAVFFALHAADESVDLDLWFLDPYALNRETFGSAEVLDVRVDLKHTYFDYFVEPKATPEWRDVVAIYPQRRSSRLSGQLATFTLHTSSTPLEELKVPGVCRFTLAAAARPDAERYLRLAGINDYSLFPDLDGLARLLQRRIEPSSQKSPWG